MTGTGELPEAFGIPKTVPASSYARDNKQKRAFMGWKGKVTASLLDSKSITWTQNFWERWQSSTDVSLNAAITFANSVATPSGGIMIYGDPNLTWSN